MNSLDFFIVCSVAYFTVRGLFKGLINELFSFLAVVLGALFVYLYGADVNVWIFSKASYNEKYLENVLLAAQFVLVAAIILGVGKLLTASTKLIALSTLNRILGGLFGFVKSVFILLAFFFLYSRIDLLHTKFMQAGMKTSLIFEFLQPIIQFIESTSH